ncbi:MAG: hypothetical protein AYK22_02550 [Thermoplasmatales archaeon SG8-52-3]|nr:MAG: hypothetical protein AYK22_02550 [Thermoplasmatales archaeon SG8-52-3]
MIKKIFNTLVVGIVLLMLGNVTFAAAYSNEMLRDSNEFIKNNDDIEPLMAPDWYDKPASYDELVSWYLDLESDYPDYLEVFKANELYDTGVVTGGYDVYYVRITNEALGLHKPEVLFLGNPHGDEVVGCVGLYWFTDWLMRMAFTGEKNDEFSKEYLQWIIDNREIYIEVLHNPYGYDHGPQRYDGNGWDLNREADMDGPGSPTGGIWASVQGKTLVEFINNHLCRIGCDFHAGVRMLLYPWGSTHSSVIGTSPISGYSYDYAPPDFYFYDTSSLRVGAFMGNYGGELDENNIGTIPGTVGYAVQGGIGPWAYGADVDKNPVEDPYVQGNYPGAGLLWLSPEMSQIKNVPESDFGNDTVDRYGAEVRWFVLHQTDLAQPYVSWHPSTIDNNSVVPPGTTVPLKWQVNGSMVVDHTYIQWGTDPDPINNYEHTTSDNDEYAGKYIGGTGWDGADSGSTNGVIYDGNLYINTPGDYYFVAKAQVDQVYSDVLRPDVYGDNPYLRLIKERTNDSYYEVLEGTDGTEEIFGQTWWYSDIIHVSVVNDAPNKPSKPDGPKNGKVGTEYTYSTKTFDDNGDKVYYQWDWDDGTTSDWVGPYFSGETIQVSHTWTTGGNYQVKVKSKDVHEYESDWSDSLSVSMPRYRIDFRSIILRLFEQLQQTFPIFNYLFNV